MKPQPDTRALRLRLSLLAANIKGLYLLASIQGRPLTANERKRLDAIKFEHTRIRRKLAGMERTCN